MLENCMAAINRTTTWSTPPLKPRNQMILNNKRWQLIIAAQPMDRYRLTISCTKARWRVGILRNNNYRQVLLRSAEAKQKTHRVNLWSRQCWIHLQYRQQVPHSSLRMVSITLELPQIPQLQLIVIRLTKSIMQTNSSSIIRSITNISLLQVIKDLPLASLAVRDVYQGERVVET